tara:strand:- start:978 stop:1217 length:240 start_codon:yes stop_codon:yes gene_type:complete
MEPQNERIKLSNEEYRVMLNERYRLEGKIPKQCCFCKIDIYFWEQNNPAPLRSRGKCCNNCNENKVIPARLAKWFSNTA